MRLLITTDTVGGVWTYTKELTEGMLAQNHSVMLLSLGRKPSPDQVAWVRRIEARATTQTFRYVATSYSLEWMQTNAACYSAAEPVLLRLIRSWRPDILHLNQFCFGALPTDVPKVVIAHSDVMSWSEACRGELPADSPWFRHYRRVTSEGLAQANAVVAPTRWMMKALCAHHAVVPHRRVIANGRALPHRTTNAPRKLQAVTIGRVWDEGKNIRVLEEISSPIPVLVGGELSLDSEPPFTSSRLKLLGPLSEEATLRLFAESSIYIVTSRYEPFGLAPLEAALSGCAIVAHDIPSLREVWGKAAYYFQSADALERLLHALHADRALLARAALHAQTRAHTLFSRSGMIDAYLALYARLGAPAASLTNVEAPAQHAS